MHNLTIHELSEQIRKKEISAVELAEMSFARIEEIEDKISAFITLTKDEALKKARDFDERMAKGEKFPPLGGIPVGLKDNLCTKGIKTTCASKILHNYIPPYTAAVVERLENMGAIPIGKLNMDEFAMGSSCENSAFHATKNPWNIQTVPGGSSGGSAASVAADEVVFALGSDTGGSIRQPASFCGVVGMKPTYGRVSRFGLVAFASSLDQIGPLTKDVEDCALVMNAIAFYDQKDSTSVPKETPNYTKALSRKLSRVKTIGVIKELMAEGIDPQVKKVIEEAIKVYQKLGANIKEISMPSFEYALSIYYLIATAEASSNLERYDGVKYGHRAKDVQDLLTMYYKTRSEGFGPEVKRRIMLGTYALSAGYYDAYYLKAMQIRTLIREDYNKAFSECDVLLSPTAPSVAFKIGEKTEDPLSMYLSDIATIPVNLAGVPAISIPCGFDRGLPIGLQIMGKFFDEESILEAAYAFEQATEWHAKKPGI